MAIDKLPQPWVGKLLDEYHQTMDELQQYHDQSSDKEERSDINRLLSNLSYSVQWMKTGREPGSRRGAERNYQTSIVYDTELFPSLRADPEREITEQEKQQLTAVMLCLTKRERDVYILHKAYLLTQRQIAYELNISRRTVRTLLKRASEKIIKTLSPTCRP